MPLHTIKIVLKCAFAPSREGAAASRMAHTLPASPPSPQPSPIKGEGAKNLVEIVSRFFIRNTAHV